MTRMIVSPTPFHIRMKVMKVETVKSTIKFSQDIGHGWKSLEIGAEGTTEPRETRQAAQSYLYAELSKQLRSMWANGRPAPRPNNALRAALRAT